MTDRWKYSVGIQRTVNKTEKERAIKSGWHFLKQNALVVTLAKKKKKNDNMNPVDPLE